jgi:hypothetical protein
MRNWLESQKDFKKGDLESLSLETVKGRFQKEHNPDKETGKFFWQKVYYLAHGVPEPEKPSKKRKSATEDSPVSFDDALELAREAYKRHALDVEGMSHSDLLALSLRVTTALQKFVTTEISNEQNNDD